LNLLAEGLNAQAALESLKQRSEHLEYRQLALLDHEGRAAAFSGEKTLVIHAVALGRDAVAAGNLLKHAEVPARLLAAFQDSESLELGDRLINALTIGLEAGGELGPVHSAGLVMVRDVAWPVADLRVDWHHIDPIAELAKLWQLWKPQMDDYVTRALNPASAPSYGVPGNR